MKRYSIFGKDYYTGNVAELCQVNDNPEAVASAAARKRAYSRISIVDRLAQADDGANPDWREYPKSASSPTDVLPPDRLLIVTHSLDGDAFTLDTGKVVSAKSAAKMQSD